MALRKDLGLLVTSLALSGSLSFLSGCGELREERRRQIEEWRIREAERVAEANRQFNELVGEVYSHSLIVANYSVPFVEISSRKEVLSLDPWDHIAAGANSVSFSLPVSEKYFNSVREGQILSSQFNGAAFLFEGSLEGYTNLISKKSRSNMYLAVCQDGVTEISQDIYLGVLERNHSSRDYLITRNKHSVVLCKPGVNNCLKRDFTGSVGIVLETTKQNMTLDIWKHLENGMNSMRFPIEVPAFLGKNLKVGDVINQNFVGASLFFSSSPSEVIYQVVEKQ